MMCLASFLPHLGETFEVYIGEGESRMPIMLVEANEIPQQHKTVRADAFQLKFTGPGPAYLRQMIHRLSHPALGEVEIFLVPIGTQGDGFLYQAIFN